METCKRLTVKHKDAKMEYSRERTRDLMRALDSYMESCPFIRMSEAYRTIVNMPSSRFWVSDKRAAVVVSEIGRGKARLERMHPLKAEMYMEIYRKVTELRTDNPQMAILEACSVVVDRPAPKFYLSPRTAEAMVGKARQKWLEEKWRRLRRFL